MLICASASIFPVYYYLYSHDFYFFLYAVNKVKVSPFGQDIKHLLRFSKLKLIFVLKLLQSFS